MVSFWLFDVTLATTTATSEASSVENKTVPAISTITLTDKLTTPPSLSLVDKFDTAGKITVSTTTGLDEAINVSCDRKGSIPKY